MGIYLGTGSVKTPTSIYVGAGGVKSVKAVYVGVGSIKQVWPTWGSGYGIIDTSCSSWTVNYIGSVGSVISTSSIIGTSGNYITISQSGDSYMPTFVTNESIHITPSSVFVIDGGMATHSNDSGTSMNNGPTIYSICGFTVGFNTNRSTNTIWSTSTYEYYYSNRTSTGLSGGLNIIKYGSANGYYGHLTIQLPSSATIEGNYYITCSFRLYTGTSGTATIYLPCGIRLFDSVDDVTYTYSNYWESNYITSTITLLNSI